MIKSIESDVSAQVGALISDIYINISSSWRNIYQIGHFGDCWFFLFFLKGFPALLI